MSLKWNSLSKFYHILDSYIFLDLTRINISKFYVKRKNKLVLNNNNNSFKCNTFGYQRAIIVPVSIYWIK